MRIIENRLIYSLKQRATMENKFHRYFLAPLLVLFLVGVVDLANLLEWYTLTLAFPLAGLAIGIWYGGLRANLASALIISVYAFMTYDLARFAQVAIAAFLIAGSSGILKRSLRANVLEGEYYRQKAMDSVNGNRAKMVEALDQIDRALAYIGTGKLDDPLFISVMAARKRLADTLTLTDSWREMAQSKQVAIQGIAAEGGLSYRAYELGTETNLLIREALADIRYIRRVVESEQPDD
jgi:hypothetical protein